MKRSRSLPICLGLAVTLAASPLAAQPTVSSSPFQSSSPATKAPLTVAQSGNVDIYPMVEQQGYTIEQLKSQQRDRYLDLDQRLLNLDKRLSQAGGSAVPAQTPSSGQSASAPTMSASGATEEIDATPGVVTEAQKKAYQQ